MRLFSETWFLLRTAYRQFLRDAGGIIAGATAFYTALALVPIALLALSLAGHALGQSDEAYLAVRQALQQALPGRTSADVLRAVHDYSISHRLLVNIVAVLGLLWSGINLFGTISMVLTTIWVGRPERSFLTQRLVGLLALVAAGVLFAANILLTSAIAALHSLEPRLGRLAEYVDLLGVLPLLASALLAVLTFFLLYRFLPGGRVVTRAALIAAISAALLWLLSRWAFSALVAGSSRYGRLYGPLAGAVLLLLWIYYSAYIMIFCAELGIAAQHRYWPQATRPPGTM